ncbi:chromosome segregation protein SMC, partial [Roseomonas hellenica]|nr:chromosome segregation protein SMC [Plastoroseomonas hellenica]
AGRARRAGEQHARLAAERAEVEAARVPHARLEAARDIRLEAEDVEGAARGVLEGAEAARLAATNAHAEARRTAAEANAEIARLTAEIEGLAQMLRAGDATHPPILEALALPSGLEVAVAAALGDALESAADDAAPRFWRALPALPAAALPGAATPLTALVEAPPALHRALSGIGLLPEGADGDALQAALTPGQALVSRDGALWRWDGHVTRAGAPSAAAVRLAQRNRLRAAEAARRDVLARAEALTHAAELAAQVETEAQAAERSAREARAVAEKGLAAERAAEAKLLAEAAAIEGRITALDPQIAALATGLAEAEAARQAAEAALAALPDAAVAERDCAAKEQAAL